MDPCPQRKGGGAPLGRGLGHPRAQRSLQLSPWGRPHPTRTAGSPRVRDPAGPRWGPQAAAPRPTRRAHSPAQPPPCALPARPSANSGRASPAAAAGGRGRRPRPANQERPSEARGQSTTRLPALGGPDGHIPEGSLRLPRLIKNPRTAAQWTFPPRLSRGGLYHCTSLRGKLWLDRGQSRGRKETSHQWEAGVPGPRAVG